MELQRPKRSADEIAALPPFGSPEGEAHIRANGPSFAPETLVYLLRESIRQADTGLFDYVGSLLIGKIDGNKCSGGHCEPIIMSVAISLGLQRDTDQLREYRALVHAAMWKAIHAGTEAKHFWEERFGLALKDKCVEIARRLAARRRREALTEVDIDDSEIRPTLSDGSRQAQHGLGAIDEKALLDLIRALPDRQASAAFLAWVEHRPLAGKSPGSVAEVMGISETAVHNLLAKAKAKLATNRTVRELRGDA